MPARAGWLILPFVLMRLLETPLAPAMAQECVGDCNGDLVVQIDELVLATNVALAVAPPSACPAVDENGDGVATIDEVTLSVGSSIGGCHLRTATPRATQTATPRKTDPPPSTPTPRSTALPLAFVDGKGFTWAIDGAGVVVGEAGDGIVRGLQLEIDLPFGTFDSGRIEDGGREVEIGPRSISGLKTSRKIFVPNEDGFIRYLEIVSNQTPVSRTVTFEIESELESGAARVVDTSSGDTRATRQDDYVVTTDPAKPESPMIGHVFSGPDGEIEPSQALVDAPDNELRLQFRVSVPSGQRAIILHFATKRNDRSESLRTAERLRSLLGSALRGLSPEELDDVVNFRALPDRDGDGLPDEREVELGTNPDSGDGDDDGLLDGFEVQNGLNLSRNDAADDPDRDGTNNLAEQQSFTDPNDADSDDDGLDDGDEIKHATIPIRPDSDYDGLPDGAEVDLHGTDPLDEDSDAGGRTDGEEVNLDGTNPLDLLDDRALLYALESRGRLLTIDPQTAAQTYLSQSSSSYLGLEWSRDGRVLYALTGTGVDAIDRRNGNALARVALDAPLFVRSIAFDSEGRVLGIGVSPSDTQLVHLDLQSGVVTTIGPIGYTISAIAFDRKRGSLFGIGLNSGAVLLLSIDPTTGNVTDVVTTELTPSALSLACGLDGKLLSVDGGNLVQLDPETGAVDPIGPVDSFGVYSLSLRRIDSDEDGLTDQEETRAGTSRFDPDTDDDGLTDAFEVRYGLDPIDDADALQDPDEDGLDNLAEQEARTDPNDSDTDDDGLADDEEILTYDTNPHRADTDGDALDDGLEVHTYGTDPLNRDTDDAGRTDGQEVTLDGTDPLDPSDDLPLLYGANPAAGQLLIVDPITGAAEVVGALTSTTWSVREIEWAPSGRTLHATTEGSGLFTVDPESGEVLTSLFLDRGTLHGLEFDAGGRLLGTYRLSSSPQFETELVAVDVETGALEHIGPTGINRPIDGLVYDPAFRTLYGITSGEIPAVLYAINPRNGQAIELTEASESVQLLSLEMDPDGRLLAGGADGNLYTLDPESGVLALIGRTKVDSVSGLSFRLVDDDLDGLTNAREAELETDPLDPDSDHDGLDDGFEVFNGLNPRNGADATEDPDGDRLTNLDEQAARSDPNDADTDEDGLDDGLEINTYGSDPLWFDTDRDGLSDGTEVNVHGTDPANRDTDGGGRSDGEEINHDGTNPLDIGDDRPLLYGMDGYELLIIDPDTGATTSVARVSGLEETISEIEWSPDGRTLYAATDKSIVSIDPATWTVTTTLPHEEGSFSGLEFDVNGDLLGLFYRSRSSEPPLLVRIDLESGALTTIGSTGRSASVGLAFNRAFDTLFSIESDFQTATLLSVEPTSGEATAITQLQGVSFFAPISLEIDLLGRLLATTIEGSLYEIDISNGLPQLIGRTGTFSPFGLSFRFPDADRDGLANLFEGDAGTDVNDPDSDGDGLRDGFEVNHGLDPLADDAAGDADGDGLDNLGEQNAKTDPRNPDTDGDGLIDGTEVNVYGTDPKQKDSDDDGLTDGAEVTVYATNPLDPDTDGGGRSDGVEVNLHDTDPLDGSDDRAFLYASGALRNRLLLIEPETGEVTIVGPFTGAPRPVLDIAWARDGETLYGVTDDTIHTIDPASGTILHSAPLPASGRLDGLEVDVQGRLFASFQSFLNGAQLVLVDPETGGLTMIGPIGFEFVTGLAFEPTSGSLYGIAGNRGYATLLSIDPQTGAGRELGTTTVPSATLSLPLTFDSQSRLLTVGSDGVLYEIDSSDGTSTALAEVPSEVSGLSFRPKDLDGDGLDNLAEAYVGTDPNDPDTDDDGLADGFEVSYGLDPLQPGEETLDPDDDGLDNLGEQTEGTDPYAPDSDRDGLVDGAEVGTYMSDPLRKDSDGGGRLDGEEANLDGTNPTEPFDDLPVLFALDPSRVWTIEPSTAEGTVVTGLAGLARNFTDFEWSPSGDILYGVSNGRSIFSIDLTNGSSSLVATLQLPSQNDLVGAIEADVNGLYCTFTRINGSVLGSFFGRIDLARDGRVEDVVAIDLEAADSVVDLVFDGEMGRFVAVTQDGRIVTIDRESGATIELAAIELAASVEAAELAPNGRVLLGTSDGTLQVVDLSSGTVTLIGSTGADALMGISFRVADSDRDGLPDRDELAADTDPLDGDTDDDGLFDGFEVHHGLDALDETDALADPDEDGLDNLAEQEARTDPRAADTDGDGLDDAAELSTHGTDPNRTDTDFDGLDDGIEIGTYGTDPLSGDSDRGGRTDSEEVIVDGTDPRNAADDRVVLWAADSFNGLRMIDPTTGEILSSLTFLGLPSVIGDIEWSPDGRTLYVNAGTRQIYAVDPFARIVERIARHPLGDLDAMELDADGALLGTLASLTADPRMSRLIRIDLSTGQPTEIGSTDLGRINGLAFDRDFRILFGITNDNPPDLLSLDRATGHATKIATTDLPGAASSLEVDLQGRLLTVSGGRLFELDPLYGTATLIGGDGDDEIVGLSFRWIDSDADGLTDAEEASTGTNPEEEDSDGDGLRDDFEVRNGLDALTTDDGGLADPDDDGLTNLEEQTARTKPNDADTDDDDLTDAQELKVYGTDPFRPDTDGDGLTDAEEIQRHGTDPLERDTDGGGRTDGREVNGDGTDPLDPADDLPTLFAVDIVNPINRQEFLLSIDPNNAQATTIGGLSGFIGAMTDIEWSRDGQILYGTSYVFPDVNYLHVLDPVTARAQKTVQIATGAAILDALEHDADDRLLASLNRLNGNADLLEIDPQTGASQTIGSIGFANVYGLAFDAEHAALYGVAGTGDHIVLLSIDPQTGAGTEIGTAPLMFSPLAGALELDPSGRLLTVTAEGNLYELDASDGSATLVGSSGATGLSGLSFRIIPPSGNGSD